MLCAHHQGVGTAKPSPLPHGKYPNFSSDVQGVDPTDTQKLLKRSLPALAPPVQPHLFPAMHHFWNLFFIPHSVHQVKHEDYFAPNQLKRNSRGLQRGTLSRDPLTPSPSLPGGGRGDGSSPGFAWSMRAPASSSQSRRNSNASPGKGSTSTGSG